MRDKNETTKRKEKKGMVNEKNVIRNRHAMSKRMKETGKPIMKEI